MADEGLEVIQSMIDFSADRLDRLRTQCATSAELTQQETRSLESKLVRLFCDLLLTRQQLSETPATNDDLRQWLRVVGLNLHTINAVMQHVNTLETLLKLNDDELCAILTNSQGIQNEETRRLVCAINNLKRCQQCVKNGTEPSDMYWDSWDRKNNIRVKTIVNNRLTTINVEHDDPPQSPSELSPPDQHSGSSLITNSGTLTSSSEKIISNNLISPEECSGISNLSPSPSPPQSPPVTNLSSSQVVSNKKKPHRINNLNNIFKTNMSSNLGNQLNNNTDVDIDMISHDSGVDGMSKSRSGDLQLSVNGHLKIWPNTAEGSPTSLVAPRTKFTIEDENNHVSALINDTSAPPRSPLTPVRGMHHIIQHRFATKFKINSTCDLCNKQLFFGLKCTECKYRCHKDCKSNVPPSCGLPKELVDEFKKTLHSEGLMPNASPNLPIRNGLIPNKRNDLRHRHNAMHNVPFHGADSSSAGSSCNSSSPSSPALLTIPPQTPANKSQFNFPEVSNGSSLINHSLNNHLPNTIIEDSELEFNQQTSLANQHFKNGDSNLCIRNNHISINESLILSEFNGSIVDSNGTQQSIDSDKTLSVDDSDRMTPRLESMDDRDNNMWPRQNSLSLKEWDIPFKDLKLDKLIGVGRFGTVHRSNWHGDVAVKVLKENFLDDEQAIEAFKLEVAIFKNTRHDNLVLFMGACMTPPNLAIVTSYCKGQTLHTHIHNRRDRFNLIKTTQIAMQIAQGMSYLHGRGIVHKELKSKNIFLENEKVIITDFGIFSVRKLTYDCDKGLGIPAGWLCYLAPELIRNLKPYRPTNEDLPFTKASDTFAFGAIWYELLCGEYPFKSQPHESVIWQVGRGMKQSLSNLQASREVKDILMTCWSYQAEDRPDFNQLFTTLKKLPKKRLARSPSHPIQLSRSAESVF